MSRPITGMGAKLLRSQPPSRQHCWLLAARWWTDIAGLDRRRTRRLPRDLGMPTANPGAVRLLDRRAGSRLTAEFRALVDQQKLAGVTTLVSRHGKVVHFDTYGKQRTRRRAKR
jgi:hypothetical protein